VYYSGSWPAVPYSSPQFSLLSHPPTPAITLFARSSPPHSYSRIIPYSAEHLIKVLFNRSTHSSRNGIPLIIILWPSRVPLFPPETRHSVDVPAADLPTRRIECTQRPHGEFVRFCMESARWHIVDQSHRRVRASGRGQRTVPMDPT